LEQGKPYIRKSGHPGIINEGPAKGRAFFVSGLAGLEKAGRLLNAYSARKFFHFMIFLKEFSPSL
jgi:hypothetical protein